MQFYKGFGTERGCQNVFYWKTKLLNLVLSSNSNGRDDGNFTKYDSVWFWSPKNNIMDFRKLDLLFIILVSSMSPQYVAKKTTS